MLDQTPFAAAVSGVCALTCWAERLVIPVHNKHNIGEFHAMGCCMLLKLNLGLIDLQVKAGTSS